MRISDWSSDVCSSDLGLDLACGDLPGLRGLEAVLAETDEIAVPGQAVIAALVHLAVLGSLGLQHDQSLASRSRRGPRGRSRSPRSPRDRTSVVSGKSVSVRVDLGGRRSIKKKRQKYTMKT